MLFTYCMVCFKQRALQRISTHFYLCSWCKRELNDLGSPPHQRCLIAPAKDRSKAAVTPLTLITCYHYEAPFRGLLLRAKIRNDLRALQFLTVLILKNPMIPAAMIGCQAVMPAPSSFWGRWHGRLDVAGSIAVNLAKAHDLPLLEPPWHLRWRWHKRAQVPRAQRLHKPSPKPYGCLAKFLIKNSRKQWQNTRRRLGNPSHVLIIDDVVTTGFTLRILAEELAKTGVGGVTLLALGDALKS